MTSTPKMVLLALAALFVMGMATSGQAQQANTQVSTADSGYDAYGYVAPGSGSSCTTEGSYGQGIDEGACNGGN